MDSVQTDSADNGPVNTSELLARCLGRVDLVERILQRFRNTLGQDVQRLEEAIRAERPEDIALVAHRIKGASLAVSAHVLTDCARSLEASANARQWDDIAVQLEQMKRESSRVHDLGLLVSAGNVPAL